MLQRCTDYGKIVMRTDDNKHATRRERVLALPDFVNTWISSFVILRCPKSRPFYTLFSAMTTIYDFCFSLGRGLTHQSLELWQYTVSVAERQKESMYQRIPLLMFSKPSRLDRTPKLARHHPAASQRLSRPLPCCTQTRGNGRYIVKQPERSAAHAFLDSL